MKTCNLSPILIRVDRKNSSTHPRHIYPPMDLKYIQTELERVTGKKIPLIDSWLSQTDDADFFTKFFSYNPTVAIIKAATPCFKEMLEIGQALRERGVITIGIGQHVDHMAKIKKTEWSSSIDIPVLGEPEQIVPSIFLELMQGKKIADISSIFYERLKSNKPFLIENPDELPKPNFTFNELADYAFPFPLPGRKSNRWGYVMTSWGCPHKCLHCSGVIRKTYGKKSRLRSPANVVDEIVTLLNTGADAISFEDDSFLSDKKHFLAICNEIINRGLYFPWIAHARADELDQELIAIAKQAGAILFKIGVESGSPKIIEKLGKASSGKEWVNRTKLTFNLLKEYKIGSVAIFLIGSPGEELSDVKKSIELSKSIKADYIQVQIFSLYPDSPFFLKMKANSIDILEFNQFHYSEPSWSPSVISPHELMGIQKEFYKNFYLRSDFITKHLKQCWRYYFSEANSFKQVCYPLKWISGLDF